MPGSRPPIPRTHSRAGHDRGRTALFRFGAISLTGDVSANADPWPAGECDDLDLDAVTATPTSRIPARIRVPLGSDSESRSNPRLVRRRPEELQERASTFAQNLHVHAMVLILPLHDPSDSTVRPAPAKGAPVADRAPGIASSLRLQAPPRRRRGPTRSPPRQRSLP